MFQEEIATFATHYLINTSTNDGTVQGPAEVMMLLPCHVAILSAEQQKTTQNNQNKVRPTTPQTHTQHPQLHTTPPTIRFQFLRQSFKDFFLFHAARAHR